MALNPLFTVTFNASGRDNYNDFINSIRRQVANPRHFSHNRPVLPPAEEPPRRWFHVVLRSTTRTLTLAVRADNLYLEGFRSSDGTWWELTRGIIGGGNATYAGFGGSYSNLLGETDRMIDVTLGPEEMAHAIDTLAARTRGGAAAGQREKVSVATILLMVNEAVRFVTVAGMVAGLMDPRAKVKSGKINAKLKEQVNGWKDLSRALLIMDALQLEDPDDGKNKKPDAKKAEDERKAWEAAQKLAVEAAKAVGILLFVDSGDKKVPRGMTKAKALDLFRGTGI
uniref:rRNA N-glycosylase n=1 Tax=Leersia perrieri TaxID=77586 RepID=A0A0D9UX73_9ORYZ